MLAREPHHPPALGRRQPPPHPEAREQEPEHDAAEEDHAGILAHDEHPGRKNPARRAFSVDSLDSHVARSMSDFEDPTAVDDDSLFASAIREHLELKARNAGLEQSMPLDPYLDGDPLRNHPLFKSEEQARIEETMDGEPASQLSSERLPWPGEVAEGEVAEETVESAAGEGPALDEALWTGRPRDFDWGD